MTWNVPKYIQLQEKLKKKIIKGEYEEGSRLPSQRELMASENVSYATVMRVFQELEAKGLINRIHGKGTFVAQGVNVEIHNNEKRLVVKTTGERTIYMVTNRPLLNHNERGEAENFNGHMIMTEIIRGILDGSRQFGVKVENLYFPESEFDDPEKLLAPYYTQDNIGFYFFHYNGFQHVVKLLKEKRIPYLVTGAVSALEDDINCIMTNVKKPYYQLTRALIDQGHECIAFVDSERKRDLWSLPKLNGYKQAFRDCGMNVDETLILKTQTCPDETETYMLNYLAHLKKSGAPLPTAYICVNDLRALGVLNALHKKKIRVPDEAVIIGFDNIPQVSNCSPPLTTISRELHTHGIEACRLLNKFIEDPDIQPLVKVMKAKLIVRESCPFDPKPDFDYSLYNLI